MGSRVAIASAVGDDTVNKVNGSDVNIEGGQLQEPLFSSISSNPSIDEGWYDDSQYGYQLAKTVTAGIDVREDLFDLEKIWYFSDIFHLKGDKIVQNASVPEPATMLLFGTGLAGLAAFGRRRRMH